MQPVLEVKQLEKVYGNGDSAYQALKDINFSINKGEFVGIMGPSGAGKSTLLNLIATIDAPTHGSIEIDGSDITKLNEAGLADFRRDKLGFVFQDYNLLPNLTASENIALPLVLAKAPANVRKTKVETLGKLLEIDRIMDQYPSTLSGGQKQRVSAARALASDPALLLADEPTGALDSKSSKELLECFQRINQKAEATIVMVTHDNFSASYCDRILFIKDGQVVDEINKGDASDISFFDHIVEQTAKLEAIDVE